MKLINGTLFAVGCALIVAGCGDDKKNEEAKTAPVKPIAKVEIKKIANPVVRTVMYNLVLTGETEQKIRRAGLNPVQINAQMVRYEFDGKVVPYIEVSQRPIYETSVAETPAYIFEVAALPMVKNYVAKATLATQSGKEIRSMLTIGRVDENQQFELCTDKFECQWTSDKGQLIFNATYPWL